MQIRHRLFAPDPAYVALQDLDAHGKYYSSERASSDASLDSEAATTTARARARASTSGFRKRISLVIPSSSSPPSSSSSSPAAYKRLSRRLSLSPASTNSESSIDSGSNQWKRASFHRALAGAKDAFAIPLSRRGSKRDSVDGAALRKGDKEEYKWWSEMQKLEFGCMFTIGHSSLFVPS